MCSSLAHISHLLSFRSSSFLFFPPRCLWTPRKFVLCQSGCEGRRGALAVIRPDVARVISTVRTFTPFSQSGSDVWQLFSYLLQDWLSVLKRRAAEPMWICFKPLHLWRGSRGQVIEEIERKGRRPFNKQTKRMSKLNHNEVLYWCHRETPFLLAPIHREDTFAASWKQSELHCLAHWHFRRSLQTYGTLCLSRPPISVSAWKTP